VQSLINPPISIILIKPPDRIMTVTSQIKTGPELVYLKHPNYLGPRIPAFESPLPLTHPNDGKKIKIHADGSRSLTFFLKLCRKLYKGRSFHYTQIRMSVEESVSCNEEWKTGWRLVYSYNRFNEKVTKSVIPTAYYLVTMLVHYIEGEDIPLEMVLDFVQERYLQGV
jgi:hypothetical protein